MQAKYRPQRGIHLVHPFPKHSELIVVLSNDLIDPRHEATSSSSETSPDSMSRKSKTSYLPRKSGKNPPNQLKRHVHSSSGYSSHNEEMTSRYQLTDITEIIQVQVILPFFCSAYRISRMKIHTCCHQ